MRELPDWLARLDWRPTLRAAGSGDMAQRGEDPRIGAPPAMGRAAPARRFYSR